MSLDATLSIASGSLANINRQLALVSQNVANAATPGYAREVSTQQSLTAAGLGMGVRSGPAQRNIGAALQASMLQQNAAVSGLQTRQAALQAIDAALGTPGQASDLPSLLGKMQDAFSTLASGPDSQTQQQAVVSAAGTLASGINALSSTYTSQRQAANDAIQSDLTTLNGAMGTISSLTKQIVTLKSSGQSTADLESQRDAALQSVSQIVNLKVLQQDNGNVVLVLGSGLSPSLDTPNPFSTAPATIGAGSAYPGGGIPAITLGGADVTAQLVGGSLGANIALRDSTLPTDQAELDEFSRNLASRFDAQGLRLFSDPSGNVPSGGGVPVQSGYVGFAASIQVNPAVQSAPSLVRDGTQAVAGSPTGASAFTPNPAGGPAGFTTLITRVLDFALGSEAQSGVAQPAFHTTGLGPTGAASSPYAGSGALGDLATAMVGAQAQDSAAATGQLATEQAVQTTLQSKFSAQSGVSMDTEMSTMVQLQNAYGASARLISAAQAMWTQLLSTVQ
jgi:flagellar hook-associated protein 1 FlgK